MDPFAQSIDFIQKSNNILLLPPKKLEKNTLKPISDLYYTLKKLGKNVNLDLEDFEDNQNIKEREFILSINILKKELKNMYYEEDGQKLDIHLGLAQGKITDNDISIQEKQYTKKEIDLIITVGKKEIETNDDDFGFFFQKPIINIDNDEENKIFGEVNLVFPKMSLNEIIYKLINKIENVPETFNKLLFRKILEKLTFFSPKNIYLATLEERDFQETKSKPKDIAPIIKELKLNPYLSLPNFLLLWEYHHSPILIRGIFFAQDPNLAKKILNYFPGQRKKNGALFQIKDNNLNSAKEKILKIL